MPVPKTDPTKLQQVLEFRGLKIKDTREPWSSD